MVDRCSSTISFQGALRGLRSLFQIADLPTPEPGYNLDLDKRFAQSLRLGELDLPKISLVTPSFNQGGFIEQTIRCVLLQGYRNLEYIIVDGGSTDKTLEIIKKYEPWISYWVSEHDNGMYDALNKGFSRATGEIMAWSPTGDLYEPNTFNVVGQVFQQLQEVQWLTSLYKVKTNEAGEETVRYKVDGFDRRAFRKGLNFLGGNPFARYMIQQQSTFWRKSLWDKSGGRMDDSMMGGGDFELWSRFYCHASLYALDRPMGVFMTHEGQESVENAERMLEEQNLAFNRTGGKHMGTLEGWLRAKVLRRRPFSFLKQFFPIGFAADVVRWDSENNIASTSRSFFV